MTEKTTVALHLSVEESIPFLSILTIIGVTSFATNSLIIGIICKNSRHGKIHDLFVLHSSLVDLLTACVVVPFWILSAIHSQIYFVGKVYCKVSATVSFVGMVAPVIFLSLVATSRHCSVVDRKAFPRIFSHSRSRLMVMVVWIVSILISLPPHFAWPLQREEMRCLPDLITNSWYTTAVLAFCVVLPLSASFYTHIYDIFIGFQPERIKRDDSMRIRCGAVKRYALKGCERTTQKAFFSILIIHTCCWAPYTCVAMVQTMTGRKSFYLGNVPVHFIALVVGLTGTTLKGVVACFEVPYIKGLIKKQFGCAEREQNEENTSQEV